MSSPQRFESNTSTNLYGTDNSQVKPSPINSDWFLKQTYTGSTDVSLRAFYCEEEIYYYEALFNNLTENGINCDANKAAPFLRKSGCKVEDLKNIWRSVGTDPKKLEKEEFFHFCKYLACLQCDIPAIPENLNKPLKVVDFVGVDSALIIAEQKKLQEKSKELSSPSKNDDDFKKSEASPIKSPEKIFSQPQYSIEGKQQTYEKFAVKLADQNTQMIKMTDCKGYLNNSGIDVENLKKIVGMTNPNNSDTITKDEFCLMLHLIFLVKKENLSVPNTIPLELSYLRRDFKKELAKSTTNLNDSASKQQPQIHDNDKLRLMDLTEYRQKYEDVQQKGIANLERVRKNNQEILTKKKADLLFMDKVLENYKNLLMKIQKECGVIEEETNYVRGIITKGNVNDAQLIREMISTIRERNRNKSNLEKNLMQLIFDYDIASDKLVGMLDRERESKGEMERKINSLEDELAQVNFRVKQTPNVVNQDNGNKTSTNKDETSESRKYTESQEPEQSEEDQNQIAANYEKPKNDADNNLDQSDNFNPFAGNQVENQDDQETLADDNLIEKQQDVLPVDNFMAESQDNLEDQNLVKKEEEHIDSNAPA